MVDLEARRQGLARLIPAAGLNTAILALFC